jgi:dihydroorotase
LLTRRDFSKSLLSISASPLALTSLLAAGQFQSAVAEIPDQQCDLLIKGGTVLDPVQGINAMLDVAVNDHKIQAVAQDIPESKARRVILAKNRIITPGWIDLHVHCFDGIAAGINADHYCLGRGVTTVVDAGSTGYPMIGGFVKYVINTSVTRIRALVHIGALGVVVGMKNAMDNLDWLNPELTARAAENNKPAVVGIKVHLDQRLSAHSKDLEMVFLDRALEAARLAQIPLMAHISNTYHPLPDILKKLRKGDVFTHCFNHFPHNLLDANGKILPEVREARERGIFFDVAEGHFNLNFEVAERCLQQDFLPDSISTDLNKGMEDCRVFDLPTMVSKFMALGLGLGNAIERVTARPARAFDYGTDLGTLRTGSEANLAIFEVRDGNFEFEDSNNGKRTGRQRLINTGVVCRGQFFENHA